MAGGYAHMTAAAEALGRLKKAKILKRDDRRALKQLRPVVEVGAISPDYPYMGGQAVWADRMHYQHTGEVIRNGVRIVRTYRMGERRRNYCLAWLFGYAAHVATDLTIHPVVEGIVGPYAENKKRHRVCEMHQDAYIWAKRDLGDIGVVNALNRCIGDCTNSKGNLRRAIRDLWRDMLRKTYGPDFEAPVPEFDAWNSGFRRIVEFAAELGTMVAITRHLLEDQGIVYPKPDSVEDEFILDLSTPEGAVHYDAVFERAVESILEIWATMGEALYTNPKKQREAILAAIPDGNLDTGRDLAKDRYIYWRQA
ncbi:MAG: zinc dependent phospholipase C family protein [Magnetospiraceae bacterium]